MDDQGNTQVHSFQLVVSLTRQNCQADIRLTMVTRSTAHHDFQTDLSGNNSLYGAQMLDAGSQQGLLK